MFCLLDTRLRGLDSENSHSRTVIEKSKSPRDRVVSPEGLGASRLPSFARMACPGRSLVFAPLLSEAQRAVLHRILSAVLSTEGFGDLSAGTTRSFRRKDLTLDQVLFTPKTIALKTSRSKDPTWLKQKENTVEMITSEASQIKMRGDRGAIRQ